MATITDFDTWLEEAAPEGYEEIYALYKCVEGEEDFGAWECGKNNNMLFIKTSHTSNTLMLASPKAKQAFLTTITSRYVGEDGMSMEGWYEFRRSMAKNG